MIGLLSNLSPNYSLHEMEGKKFDRPIRRLTRPKSHSRRDVDRMNLFEIDATSDEVNQKGCKNSTDHAWTILLDSAKWVITRSRTWSCTKSYPLNG